jgi:hypothetical protein
MVWAEKKSLRSAKARDVLFITCKAVVATPAHSHVACSSYCFPFFALTSEHKPLVENCVALASNYSTLAVENASINSPSFDSCLGCAESPPVNCSECQSTAASALSVAHKPGADFGGSSVVEKILL